MCQSSMNISIYKKKKGNLFLQTHANLSIPRWKPHKSNDRDPRFVRNAFIPFGEYASLRGQTDGINPFRSMELIRVRPVPLKFDEFLTDRHMTS